MHRHQQAQVDFDNYRHPHDRYARLRLATLQSEAGRRLLEWFVLPTELYDSVVFVEDGRASVKSIAVLRMLRHLPWPWSWLVVGWAVPRPVRDRLYDFVARHRYRWFGRRETCMLPTPEMRSRFLDEPHDRAAPAGLDH